MLARTCGELGVVQPGFNERQNRMVLRLRTFNESAHAIAPLVSVHFLNESKNNVSKR